MPKARLTPAPNSGKEKAPPLATADAVARLAQVSRSAVSRAFTPGASVAPATRQRIMAAVDQLGYQPDMMARSLMSGRSNIVGVGVGNLANPFLSATLDLLTLQLAQAGLRLMLFPTNEASVAQVPIREVLQYRLDAMVLLATALAPELAEYCARARVPVVLYNRQAARGAGVSSVSGNNALGARAVAAVLHAGGHQRYAYIAGIEASMASHQRGDAYAGFLTEQGHVKPLRENGQHTYADACGAMRRLMLRPDRPDAVFCANDTMALAAIDVARWEFGLVVGRDVSIAGFDDIAMASAPGYALTTYAQPIGRMVDETVAIILAMRDGAPALQRVVEGGLVVRQSTRPPAAGETRWR